MEGFRRRQPQRRDPWVLRHSLLVFALGAMCSAAAFVVAYGWAEGPNTDRFDVAIKSATAVAAVAAGLLTWSRLELSRHEHRLGVDRDLSERFSRSVDQLGSGDELVRLGGVFALERFALDAAALSLNSDVDWRMALDLQAEVARRDSAPARKAASEPRDGHDQPPPDPLPLALARRPSDWEAAPTVRAALRVLSRFDERSGGALSRMRPPVVVDLTGVVAPQLDLRSAHLAYTQFAGADLRGGDLAEANLSDASFTDAALVLANLAGADLRGADLGGADLGGANLSRANLTGAVLGGASLVDTNLTDAVLRGANFIRANLSQANLGGADLTGTKFVDANLSYANLSEADLSGADLGGADLSVADLARARHDANTRWPKGFVPSTSPQT